MRNLLNLMQTKNITRMMNFNTDENNHSAPVKVVTEVTFSAHNIGIFTTDGKILILDASSPWEFGASDRVAWVDNICLSW